MNLITRTIPALILGLSGLTLSAASQADSSFSFSISTGYPAARTSYSYRESYYRPYGRYCNPYRRPRAHIDTYVEKRVYRDNGHHRRYRDDDGRDEYDEHHNRHRKYRHHDGHHYHKHGDRDDRRHHTGYARLGYY